MNKVYGSNEVIFKVADGAMECIDQQTKEKLLAGTKIVFVTPIDWNKYLDLSNEICKYPAEKRTKFYNACFAMSCDEYPWGMELIKKKIKYAPRNDNKLIANFTVIVK